MKSRRELNVEATRTALLAVARKHFANYGYSRSEIARIARDALVTTGAIYHHFDSKKKLFQAVAEQVESEILAAATVEAEDPWRRLQAGFEKLIDLCARPDVQRIIFVEAPQVIGPQAWRRIELRYTFGALRGTLTSLRGAGFIKPYPIDLVARSLLALLRETSAEVARSQRDPTVRAQIADMVAGIFKVLAAG